MSSRHHLGDAVERGLRELLAHGLERRLLGSLEESAHLLRAALDLGLLVGRLVLQLLRPRRRDLHDLVRQEQGCSGKVGGQMPDRAVVTKRQLEQVLAQRNVLRRALLHLDHALKEGQWRGRSQLEAESVQSAHFHVENLLLRVRLIRHMHEILDLGRVDLLVLRCEEQQVTPTSWSFVRF